MDILKNVLFGLALFVAVVFALLVFVTGKGDAMSGGSSVRTSFKGKASFEDFMSKLTFILGISFMVLMIGIDVMTNRMEGGKSASTQIEPPIQAPGSGTPAK